MLGIGFTLRFGRCAGLGFIDAVGDIVHHIETADIALCKEIHRVRVFFAKQGDKNIGACHFLFVGRLHMKYRALYDALKTDGRLRINFLITRCDRGVRGDEVGQHLAQLV